jgi:hypothetical protein
VRIHPEGGEMTDIIGKQAVIVGYSTKGDPLGGVAHICLDVVGEGRFFFEAADPTVELLLTPDGRSQYVAETVPPVTHTEARKIMERDPAYDQ